MRKFKEFSELKLTDDYMFCQVMQNEAICRKLLNMVLDEEIGEITSIVYQDVRSAAFMSKSVRLEGSDFVNEILREMDKIKADDKREARYMSYWKEQADLMDMRREAKYEGEEALSSLIKCLYAENRLDDIRRITLDRDYRSILYKHYGIADPSESELSIDDKRLLDALKRYDEQHGPIEA